MANCNWQHGNVCDRIATTTLTRNNGEVVQLCEFHRNQLIAVFRKIAAGEMREDAEVEANHWFVLNKIPI